MRNDLLTIGEFSRLVGVTPSALRYYDDVGLLVPAEVSAGSGYRRYAMDQRRRAVIIRMLRDAGLSLAEIRQVVDQPSGAVRRIIAAHLERNAAQATQAATALRRVMQMLEPGEFNAGVTVAGPELASGIRQVLHAIDRSDVTLARVQFEIAVDEVRLITTDRYRLALRTLPCHDFEGQTTQVGVAAAALQQLPSALLLVGAVEMRIDPVGLTCIIDGERHVLASQPGTFPDYRAMLDSLTPGAAKLVADRGALLGFLRSADPGGTVLVCGSEGRTSLIAGAQAVRLGTWIGPCVRVAFAVSRLEEALEISVGPDVIIELAEGAQPAVIRSADHGSLTTLIMPRRSPRSPGTDHRTDQKDQEYGPEQPDRPSLRPGDGSRTGGPAR